MTTQHHPSTRTNLNTLTASVKKCSAHNQRGGGVIYLLSASYNQINHNLSRHLGSLKIYRTGNPFRRGFFYPDTGIIFTGILLAALFYLASYKYRVYYCRVILGAAYPPEK